VVVFLEQDAVERALARLFGRQVVHVGAEGEGAAASAVAGRTAGLGQHVELVRDMGQVIQVAAVRVPGQDVQAAHGLPPVSMM
jgi:ubiquinone biosynthesis protein UbiJ